MGKKMKFLITGVSGQLGYDVKKELLKRGYQDIYAPTSKEMNIIDSTEVTKVILEYQPDIIFHCAAYTAVDRAEEEMELCYQVNTLGTSYIAQNAAKIGARVIYISTDYVFDGTKEGLYTEEDEACPINYYGESKYGGELQLALNHYNFIIARISWVFGINGKNFVKTMLKLAETKKELNVVSDQIGSPTYTEDLAKVLVDMAFSDKVGIYHITNEGYCSWYEFAKYIFEVNDIDIIVHPIETKDYKTKATRPLNSRLDKSKLEQDGFERLPDWKDAVVRYSKVLKKEGKS